MSPTWLVCVHVVQLTCLSVGCHVCPPTNLYQGDVTKAIGVNGSLALEIAINSVKQDGKDGLEGEVDLTTDGTNLGGWGGIGGHVTLISRAAVWINNPHIQTTITSRTYDAATVNTTIEIGSAPASAFAFGGGSGTFSLSVAYKDKQTNKTLGTVKSACTTKASPSSSAAFAPQTCTVPNLALAAPPLWSPTTPQNQLLAVIELVEDGTSTVLDTCTAMFGITELVIAEEIHFKMNGIYHYVRDLQPLRFLLTFGDAASIIIVLDGQSTDAFPSSILWAVSAV